MVTDIITISSTGANMDLALNQTTRVAEYKGLSPKNALHLRLLAEEMMGMMRAITHETSGKFWIEDSDGVYQLHLLVETIIDEGMRRKLLAASSTGENEASRGLMGKLREFFFRNANNDIAAYDSPLAQAGNVPNMTDWEWSLTRYQRNLYTAKRKQPEAAEAWDELEKSVVNNVADDVKVSIKGWNTEMTIIKKLN